jgi:hypothetical protein
MKNLSKPKATKVQQDMIIHAVSQTVDGAAQRRQP